eukprot:755102-Hanusia_phi.AAC.1
MIAMLMIEMLMIVMWRQTRYEVRRRGGTGAKHAGELGRMVKKEEEAREKVGTRCAMPGSGPLGISLRVFLPSSLLPPEPPDRALWRPSDPLKSFAMVSENARGGGGRRRRRGPLPLPPSTSLTTYVQRRSGKQICSSTWWAKSSLHRRECLMEELTDGS